MSKDDFLDQLAYGACNGSVELVSPKCIEGSPGKKFAPCPVKVVDKIPHEGCNCCDVCRSNCNWMAQIKDQSKREFAKSLKTMKKLADDYDNE